MLQQMWQGVTQHPYMSVFFLFSIGIAVGFLLWSLVTGIRAKIFVGRFRAEHPTEYAQLCMKYPELFRL